MKLLTFYIGWHTFRTRTTRSRTFQTNIHYAKWCMLASIIWHKYFPLLICLRDFYDDYFHISIFCVGSFRIQDKETSSYLHLSWSWWCEFGACLRRRFFLSANPRLLQVGPRNPWQIVTFSLFSGNAHLLFISRVSCSGSWLVEEWLSSFRHCRLSRDSWREIQTLHDFLFFSEIKLEMITY